MHDTMNVLIVKTAAFFFAALLLPTVGRSQAAGVEEEPQIFTDKVIVTAQKKEESIQDVPLAVTAFTAESIEELRIDTLDEVFSRTPGFSYGLYNALQPQPYIRGIGSADDSAAGDNSVVVFIDEVYVGRAGGMNVHFYDLERIEVLRGPQGGLCGACHRRPWAFQSEPERLHGRRRAAHLWPERRLDDPLGRPRISLLLPAPPGALVSHVPIFVDGFESGDSSRSGSTRRRCESTTRSPSSTWAWATA